MEQKDKGIQKGKKGMLIKIILFVVIAVISYYVFSGVLSGFEEAYSE